MAFDHTHHNARQAGRVGAHVQGVGMFEAVVEAVDTDVKVRAHRAPVAGAWLNLCIAVVAGGGEGFRLWVVQVIQHHHAAVLRAAQCVKLEVVALAQGQECLRMPGGSETSPARPLPSMRNHTQLLPSVSCCISC